MRATVAKRLRRMTISVFKVNPAEGNLIHKSNEERSKHHSTAIHSHTSGRAVYKSLKRDYRREKANG